MIIRHSTSNTIVHAMLAVTLAGLQGRVQRRGRSGHPASALAPAALRPGAQALRAGCAGADDGGGTGRRVVPGDPRAEVSEQNLPPELMTSYSAQLSVATEVQ